MFEDVTVIGAGRAGSAIAARLRERGVAVRENGELLVFDDHPVADCVDGLLRWRSDYFRNPAEPGRLWRIGQIVSALARAGLHVEALEEYPGGTARRGHDHRIPATFLLYARRAAA